MASKILQKQFADYRQLEVNIISAQDLKKTNRIAGRMQMYCVAWIHMDRKLSTQIDRSGGANPTWNDKVIFRVEESFLRSETSAIMIEIYCIGFLKDTLVGTVRVMLSNLLKGYGSKGFKGMSFSALPIRRPNSGRPQGILNLGIMILNGELHNMNIRSPHTNNGAVGYKDLMGKSLSPKPSLVDKMMFLKPNKGAHEYDLQVNVSPKQEKKICSDDYIPCKKLQEEVKSIRLCNQNSTKLIEKKQPCIGCHHMLFGLKSKGNKVGLRNGPAKIHLSPSDNNICAREYQINPVAA
eukprot:Gb_28901 [translate_table: standard]